MARGRKEDFGFRDLTNGLVLIVNDHNMELAKRSFEYEQFDNAILACGYIDHTAGTTFEVLCLGEYDSNGKVELRRGNPTISIKLRYGCIDGIIILLEDSIRPALQNKIDAVRRGYKVNEYIMKARNSTTFDDFRHPQFPDDVLLRFYQEGNNAEGIWCRIESEIEGRPAARLLDEPYADFGVHSGELVTFIWTELEGKMIGIAKLPWMKD